MCNMEVDLDDQEDRAEDCFADALAELAPLEACGAVLREGGCITVPPKARMLLHVVCAAFDRRLPAADQSASRHAAAV